MQILQLVAIVATAMSPVICLSEECTLGRTMHRRDKVLIQHGAELTGDVVQTAETSPEQPRTARVSRTRAAGKFHTGWLESNSVDSSSDAAKARSHHSSTGDLSVAGIDANIVDKFMTDIKYTISGGHSGNGPMWLRLHVAAGVIVFVAACIVMICRPSQSPAVENAEGQSRREAATPLAEDQRHAEVAPERLPSPLPRDVQSFDHDKTNYWRNLQTSASASTMAPSSASSGSSGDRALSPRDRSASPPLRLDDSSSNTNTEEVSSLLIGDGAAGDDSCDEDGPISLSNASLPLLGDSEDDGDPGDEHDQVSDTFEASAVYLLPSATTLVESRCPR